MKRTILILLMAATALSCTKQQTREKGMVSIELSQDECVTDMTRSVISDHTAVLPSAADFHLTLTDAYSSVEWDGNYSEWDAEMTLFEGNYTVTAVYGNLEDEGFDKPCFKGETGFSVVGGQTTQVKVTASLANTLIKVETTEYFRNYYPEYSFRLTRGGREIATLEKGESRSVFVDPYNITLEGTLQGEIRQYAFEQALSGLVAGASYTVTVDAANVGGSAVTVRFGDVVEVIDLGNIELND